MVTLALAALILGVLCMCAFVLTLAVSDFRARQERLRRSRARAAETIAATTCDTDAAIIATAEAAHSDAVALAPTLRDDPISVLRMHIALDRALDEAMAGRDITEDAPREWTP